MILYDNEGAEQDKVRYLCISPRRGTIEEYAENGYEDALGKMERGWIVYLITEKWQKLEMK